MIPARAGSKGLPGKNVRRLLGKPLVNWSIEQSLAASRVTVTHVSTDSEQIADLAAAAGADVPYLRPKELATDSASTSSVIGFALDYYENERGVHFDHVVLLEPTSPIRRPGDIDGVLGTLEDRAETFDSVLTLARMSAHPSTARRIRADGYVVPFSRDIASDARRQDLPEALYPYVIAHAVKVSAFRESGTVYTKRSGAYMVQRWQAFEIDDYVDFVCVEAVMGAMSQMEDDVSAK